MMDANYMAHDWTIIQLLNIERAAIIINALIQQSVKHNIATNL